MALRASESFVVALDKGKAVYQKDQVVPAAVARGRASLVYDDTKVKAAAAPYVRRASKAPAEPAEAPAEPAEG